VRVRELTGGRGVDHVIEVGGPGTLPQSIEAVRVGGHVSLIGVLTGFGGEVPTAHLMRKQARLHGLIVGSRAAVGESIYEMRIYTIAPGKAEDLHNRFRNHTLRLFAKHGIESVGYWMPVDKSDQRLFFLLRYPSREARETRWNAFVADPDWKAAHKASEANGALVSKAENPFLIRTDYSPAHSKGNIS
jgi:heme-degrading monooxygenase HmoA